MGDAAVCVNGTMAYYVSTEHASTQAFQECLQWRAMPGKIERKPWLGEKSR
jgi:hypothetical protein